MPFAKQVTDELLNLAAELRAGGAKWAVVAAELKRPLKTVSAWPRNHRERWEAALKAAETRALGEAANESVRVLRTQLRSEDDKTAREAAKSLADLRLDHTKLDRVAERDAAAATITSEGVRIASFLDGHTDEELTRLADAVHENAPALRHAFVESGNPALPA